MTPRIMICRTVASTHLPKSTKKGKLPPPEARFTTVLADANRKPYKSEDAQRSEK